MTVVDELWDGYVPDADACQKEVVSFVKYFFLGESIIDEDLSHRQRTQKQQLVDMVERWFRHDDFTRSNQPKGIYEEIAGLMELEVYLTRPEDRLPSVSCVTPLTGGPVTVIIRK